MQWAMALQQHMKNQLKHDIVEIRAEKATQNIIFSILSSKVEIYHMHIVPIYVCTSTVITHMTST
jgi:hypothetical protein